MRVPRRIDPSEGRRLFGIDPAGYDRARPDYPAWVYDTLRVRCGLRSGTRVVEIGAGTGLATRSLLAAGADVVAVEPDPVLARHLAAGTPGLDVRVAAFEDVELSDRAFDLAVAASSFHWVDQARGPAKVARLLRPGGWWAMWWNVFGDRDRIDPFHDATEHVLAPLADSPSGTAPSGLAFAVDVEARRRDLTELAGLVDVDHMIEAWTLTLGTDEVRALYGTYSPINCLPSSERERVLDMVARIARDEFGGVVTRNMLTAMYVGRRPSDRSAGP